MNTVSKIIEVHGGLQWLRQPGNYMLLENSPYKRLAIEYIGEGPPGPPSISVAHYYEQNGDAMRDPEIVFEIDEAGDWCPVSYLQDIMGVYHCGNGARTDISRATSRTFSSESSGPNDKP